MPRDIGHLGRDRLASEAPVQPPREAQPNTEETGIDELRVRREGEGMPGDVAVTDRSFKTPALTRRRLLQVLVNEPRPGRPDKALKAAPARLLSKTHRRRNEDVEVLLDNVRSQIGVADVEVALEDELDLPRKRKVPVIV